MKDKLNSIVHINEKGDDIPCEEVLANENHFLKVEVDIENKDVYLSFSTSLAMYDFAKSLLHQSLYGGEDVVELYPLLYSGRSHIVNGVRLTRESSRVFITIDEPKTKV